MEELMLIENPYMGYGPIRRNPKRRKNVRKNPVATVRKEWLQGVDMMDAGAALGGLAMTAMVPGMIIKDSVTGTQKLLKLGVSLLSTVGAGFIFRNISASAGRMAIAGGLAGTLSQAIAMFTNIQIGGKRQLSGGKSYRGLGESRFVPIPSEDAGVQVSVT